jgi:predicted transcriptional regulator
MDDYRDDGGGPLATFWRRRGVLAAVDGTTRSAVADRADVSRSTVDRAVSDLVDAGLVRVTGDRCRRTAAGELLLTEFARTAGTVRSATGAAAALSVFPGSAEMDPAMLADAEVIRSGTDGADPVDRFVADAETADELYLYAAFVVDRVVERYRRRIVDEGLSVAVAVAEEGLGRLVAGHRDGLRQLVAADGLEMRRSRRVLPYSVQVTDPDDPGRATASVLAVDGTESAFLGTTDPEAVEWAFGTFERAWERADPLPVGRG